MRWRLLCFAILAPAPLFAAGFTSLGPDGGSLLGFAQSPSDPDRLYCLPALLGVYRSDDHGTSWQRVSTGIALDRTLMQVAVSPADEDLVLVGDPSSDGLLRSTDGGVTWTLSPVASGWHNIGAIAFDPLVPSRVLAGIRDGAQPGLYVSTDGGVTFTGPSAGMTGPGAVALTFHSLLAGVVLAGNENGIFRSTDGGATWAMVHAGYVVGVSYCEGAPTRAWGLAGATALRSTDGGLTFAETAAQPPRTESESYTAIAAHPTDPDIALIGQVYWECGGDCVSRIVGVSRTTDGGGSWSYASYGSSGIWGEHFAALAYDPGSPANAYAAISSPTTPLGGLLHSGDSGATFLASMNGISGVGILAVDRDGGGAIYARRSSEDGLWRAPAAGSPWEERTTAGIPHPTCFLAHRTIGGRLDEGGVVTSMDTAEPIWGKSTNGGQTWSIGELPPFSLFSIPMLLRAGSDGATVYLWTDDYSSGWRLHRSDDGSSLAMSAAAFPVVGAAVDPGDPLRVFALEQPTGVVKLSTDGGATWAPRATGLPVSNPVDLFMDPADADRLTAVYRNAGAYRSDDAGLTWSAAASFSGTVAAADWDPVLDRYAIATQSDGVFVTGLGSVTDGLPTLKLTDILFDPASGKVLVATAYAGVLSIEAPDPSATPVVAGTASGLELRVEPNPFRTSTTIRLAVPDAGEVSIDILAVDGRRLITLRADASGGEATATWDGRDARGGTAAPGVYFVRVRADGGRLVSSRVVRLLP